MEIGGDWWKSVTAAVVAIAAVVVVIATVAETPDDVAVVIVPCPAKGIRTGGVGGVAGEVRYDARDSAGREDVCGFCVTINLVAGLSLAGSKFSADKKNNVQMKLSKTRSINNCCEFV